MSPPSLILPNGQSPGEGWEPVRTTRPRRRPGVGMVEAPGRRPGTAPGTYIDNLVQREKTIWLCWSCRHKFNERAHHYFYEKNLRVNGRCDGCKEIRQDSHLFIHESLLSDPGGYLRSGQSWTPR